MKLYCPETDFANQLLDSVAPCLDPSLCRLFTSNSSSDANAVASYIVPVYLERSSCASVATLASPLTNPAPNFVTQPRRLLLTHLTFLKSLAPSRAVCQRKSGLVRALTNCLSGFCLVYNLMTRLDFFVLLGYCM